MKRLLITLTVTLLFSPSFSQYPKNYFRNPLNIPIDLTANFGELRTNHWHMGLDIRTAQRENLPVHAAAEGFISRIAVEPFGFGRVLYIDHPNGYTTVYAHLNDFDPAIESYVKSEQYRLESWRVNLRPDKNQFPVRKGQFIAYSGNTGGSAGPHVHFEIRDTKTEECINPLLFGLKNDNIPPTITRLGMYERQISTYEQSPKLYSLKRSGSAFTISNNRAIETGASHVSFSLQAIDKITGSASPSGIYSAKIFLDGKELGGFELDRIHYDKTRYMNAHIDYRYKMRGGAYLQHVSRLPGNIEDVYTGGEKTGDVFLQDFNVHDVRIEVLDAHGNKSVVSFKLKRSGAMKELSGSSLGIPSVIPGEVSVFESERFEAMIDEDGVYDKIPITYREQNVPAANAVSGVHSFIGDDLPIHNYVTVRIQPNTDLSEQEKNCLIVQRDNDGRGENVKGKWESGWVSAKFDDFGSYQLFVDKTPPSINNLGSATVVNLKAQRRIVFQPQDHFGIKSFRAQVNGKWLRFTNDKGKSFIYVFDEKFPSGESDLSVRVEDVAGNVAERSWRVLR